jgi:hypothetical protein
MNNDIIFYYKHKTDNIRKLIDELTIAYPYAKFKQHKSSVDSLIDRVTFTTALAWFIDLEIIGWEKLINYKIEEWDKKYFHVFESKTAKIYLVPKIASNVVIDKKFVYTDTISYPEYDVFFIKYDENNADKNLRYLLEKRSDVKVISGVTGIFNAHLEAAKQSNTEFFWVVDADATVIDAFDFHYIVPEWDFDVVHIWKSINPINFLEYGYGAVKLIPTHLILNADEDTAVDITTSIGAKIKIINEISNINNFATSPLNAWRSAFRECVKLSSRVIVNQSDEETAQRLEVWISKGGDRPLGQYVRGGASAGKWYGETYKGNKEMLARINDYEWLACEFAAHIKMFPPETFEQS